MFIVDVVEVEVRQVCGEDGGDRHQDGDFDRCEYKSVVKDVWRG